MNKSTLIKTGLLALLAGSSLFAYKPAHAQFLDECMIVPGTGNFYLGTGIIQYTNCASASNQRSLHTYLSTGRNTSLTGAIGGAAGLNDGVIELLRKQNDSLSKALEGDRQAMPNNDLGNRSALVDAEIRRAIADHARPLSAAACRDVTAASPLGGGPRGGGAAGSNSNANQAKLDEEAENQVLEPKHDQTNMLNITMTASARRYCTQKDVDNEMPGCEETGVGIFPGANTRASTLFRRVLEKSNSSFDGFTGSYSIPNNPNNPAYQAIEDYSMFNRPFSGPDLADAAKKTGAGGQYLIYQRRYNARVLAISGTYNLIASKSIALPDSHPFVQIWDGVLDGPSQEDNYREMFKEIYGEKVIFPAAPSEREILNMLVMGQFTSKKAGRDMDLGGDDLARRQLELTKISNYIAMQKLEQLEWNNILMAHSLSNSVDPITRSELMGLAEATSGARE